jgi:hypothetical protein
VAKAAQGTGPWAKNTQALEEPEGSSVFMETFLEYFDRLVARLIHMWITQIMISCK